jgi:2-polyprenyl-6-methoxyphenol hydroxylase-like FAD-dependent oxidoreductase
MTVDIIGAGIGGLTTAIALQQKGINVHIYEKSPELKPLGAGIVLANNAMQVYEKLGLKAEIESKGNPVSSLKITDIKLRPLSNVDLKLFEQKYGCQNIAIHRGQLQQILLKHIAANSLKSGHELIGIEKKDNNNHLKFQNGIEIKSAITLGADGLNSAVRKNLFPESKIRKAFQLCWRGIIDFELPPNLKTELNEAWGEGIRFGFVQISPNQTYWYALKSIKANDVEIPLEHLHSLFKGFPEIAGELIRKTDIGQIHTTIIADLKPLKKWHKGTICLIGDAAHATTPNMGQGACQAIEDAYILAECLGLYDVENSFLTFERLRMPKVNKVVNLSWKIGKIAHWKNPMAIGIRNQLIKMTPKKLSRKQSDQIFKLESF